MLAQLRAWRLMFITNIYSSVLETVQCPLGIRSLANYATFMYAFVKFSGLQILVIHRPYLKT